jgi:glycosyltransferase involved in cell wall biosynthesis
MPNQYWKHKNHKVVIDALKLLKERGGPIPYIVSSGGKDDYRNPDYFSELMNYLGENNLEDHYLYLGKIPYIEVLGLMKIAGAMINPSRFEGWATTVEEAKMLGQKLYLSDIDVHREQAPNATFFSPDSASELSALLQKIEYKENRTWDKLRTEWELKQLEYGKAFVKLTENTIARFYGT